MLTSVPISAANQTATLKDDEEAHSTVRGELMNDLFTIGYRMDVDVDAWALMAGSLWHVVSKKVCG